MFKIMDEAVQQTEFKIAHTIGLARYARIGFVLFKKCFLTSNLQVEIAAEVVAMQAVSNEGYIDIGKLVMLGDVNPHIVVQTRRNT